MAKYLIRLAFYLGASLLLAVFMLNLLLAIVTGQIKFGQIGYMYFFIPSFFCYFIARCLED